MVGGLKGVVVFGGLESGKGQEQSTLIWFSSKSLVQVLIADLHLLAISGRQSFGGIFGRRAAIELCGGVDKMDWKRQKGLEETKGFGRDCWRSQRRRRRAAPRP
ncbi:unnamed protein product [Linum trigynum]|uniref:Uncharacterized protein n=1 Tax=Linum trigynum TaxID=586398 RepID=A0AAV2GBM6_9ROSI